MHPSPLGLGHYENRVFLVAAVLTDLQQPESDASCDSYAYASAAATVLIVIKTVSVTCAITITHVVFIGRL